MAKRTYRLKFQLSDSTEIDAGTFEVNDGENGTSVTVSNVTESTEDGGNNVVEFSNGKTLTVKNGSKGEDGVSVVGATLTAV